MTDKNAEIKRAQRRLAAGNATIGLLCHLLGASHERMVDPAHRDSMHRKLDTTITRAQRQITESDSVLTKAKVVTMEFTGDPWDRPGPLEYIAKRYARKRSKDHE